jgi:hypothetical protein
MIGIRFPGRAWIFLFTTMARLHTKLYLENLKGRDHLEDIDVNRSIILKWILKK